MVMGVFKLDYRKISEKLPSWRDMSVKGKILRMEYIDS